MASHDYVIRRLTRNELDSVFQWSASEGWNPGVYDREAFYAADPNGFFGGFLGTELIGSLSAVAYDEHYGFIGLYIVKPEFRGQGYGLALFNTALAYMGERTVGLDGVVARQADYARMGFQTIYRNVRFRHLPTAKTYLAAGIRAITEEDFTAVAAYDTALQPAPRTAFLQPWFTQPGTVTLLKHDATGGLMGYGTIRRAHEGYRIGPLFANDANSAGELLAGLCASAEPAGPVFWDVPESNPAAVALARNHHMEMVFEAARMYKGTAPELPMPRIFGATTLELG